jgi:ribose 5-phosphate isomerase A
MEKTNWIPATFQNAAQKLAKHAVKKFLKRHQVIGLGSGPMAAAIIREISNFDGKATLECIPTSYQIKLEAEGSGLRLVDESRIPEIDVVFDGADEIDSSFDMIKGGEELC